MKMLKKLRRRLREKGLFGFSSNDNAAKRLWRNDFGMKFVNPRPKMAGTLRRWKREAEEHSRRLQVGEDVMTRQRRRQAARLQVSRIRRLANAKFTK